MFIIAVQKGAAFSPLFESTVCYSWCPEEYLGEART